MLKQDLPELMRKNKLKGPEDANKLLKAYHHNNGVTEVLEYLGGEDYNRNLAVALTLYCFRNGPIEGMHAAGKLSDDDMKTLNKFMVDKIGFLLHLFEIGHYLAIDDVLEWPMMCGENWDPPNLDGEIDNYLKVLEKRVKWKEELKEREDK